jgi:AcrR family transcriptional regulator
MSIKETPEKNGKNEKSEKQKEILAAARVVFEKYGYRKTAMVDIAEEVGLNQATLYHYFDNKEEIFIEKTLEDHAEFRDEGLKLIAAESSIQDKIIRFFGFKVDYFYGNDIYEQIAELNYNKISEKHKNQLDKISIREQAFIQGLLERAIEKGELSSATDTEKITKIIFRIFQGIRFENYYNYRLSKKKAQTELLMKEMKQSIEYLFNNLKK